MLTLRPFQKPFLRAVHDPAYDLVALSLPRGNGKSTVAADILRRCLTPGDPLHQPGKEYLLVAGSLDQARLTFRPLREWMGEDGYRWSDGSTRVGVVRTECRTRIRVIACNGKTSMGIVGVPLVVADEPGAWEINGGQLVWDSLTTAQGKPDSPLKIVIVGTLAPLATGPGHWWYDLIKTGTVGSTHVTRIQGDLETWDAWPTIRKANPLTAVSPEFRKKLLAERDAARGDTRLKARFLSYRLNLPSADEDDVLLTVDDWQKVIAREVPPRDGVPLLGVDLASNRAWMAATALWQNGRLEARALAPGIPSIADQERRDQVPAGTYQRLVDAGLLRVAEGRHVPTADQYVDMVVSELGWPAGAICDRFRVSELYDAGLREVEPRVVRWSESTEDIRALRRLARDGPLSCDEASRPLVAASLAVARVKNDDGGNVRMVKRGSNNAARDDVAAALTLVAGAYVRRTTETREPESDARVGVANP